MPPGKFVLISSGGLATGPKTNVDLMRNWSEYVIPGRQD
jgi:hypothetical protein